MLHNICIIHISIYLYYKTLNFNPDWNISIHISTQKSHKNLLIGFKILKTVLKNVFINNS